MGVLTWGPLASGWLSGAIRAGQETRTNRSRMMPQRFDATLPVNGARVHAVERLVKVAADAGLTLIQLALGFVTAHPGVTSAIIGPRTVDHLRSQLAAAETVLSADVLDAIDDIVAPGTDLAAQEKNDTPPALLNPSLRRRDHRRDDRRAGGIFAGNVA
jgi:aryl-alcohol dehydrogenase-like predicted oxidoreductase